MTRVDRPARILNRVYNYHHARGGTPPPHAFLRCSRVATTQRVASCPKLSPKYSTPRADEIPTSSTPDVTRESRSRPRSPAPEAPAGWRKIARCTHALVTRPLRSTPHITVLERGNEDRERGVDRCRFDTKYANAAASGYNTHARITGCSVL